MKKTELEKCIAVWLDHEKALLIRPGQPASDIEKIFSDLESQVRIPGESPAGARLGNNRSTNDEYRRNNRHQGQLKQYYQLLASRIKSYDHIVLFGASTAKNELGNLLGNDKAFHGKTVVTQSADSMTENQLLAKVSEYFK